MKNQRIAIRYSKALFLLAKEFNLVEAIKGDMDLILEVVHTAKDFKPFLVSPIIKEEKKLKVLKEIFENKINITTLNFLNLIIGKRRFLYIDIIAEEFINLYRHDKGIKPAYIETVTPLNADNRKAVSLIVMEFAKSEIELIENIRKELIGGFILKIDDKQYDTSIKSQITKLTKEFSVNVYEKGL